MQRKMQFVAYEMAAILQNVGTQKVLTLEDVANAVQLSFLSIYPGNTLTCTGSHEAPLGYAPFVTLFCVKKSNGIVRNLWNRSVFMNTFGGKKYETATNTQHTGISNASQHPNLSLGEGETKILLECGLFSGSWWRFSSGISCGSVTAREIFNFLLFNPKHIDKYGLYFPAIAIFTPVGKAFSEAAPQEP